MDFWPGVALATEQTEETVTSEKRQLVRVNDCAGVRQSIPEILSPLSTDLHVRTSHALSPAAMPCVRYIYIYHINKETQRFPVGNPGTSSRLVHFPSPAILGLTQPMAWLQVTRLAPQSMLGPRLGYRAAPGERPPHTVKLKEL